MTRPMNVADAVDDLRQLIAKADALAHATEGLFDESVRVEDVGDRRTLEHLAHMIGATAGAVERAREAGDELAAELSSRRKG